MNHAPSILLSGNTRRALVASSLAINTLMLALPIATLQIYDRVLTHPGSGTLPMLAAGVVGAVAIETVLRLARARVTSSAAHAYERHASNALVAQVLRSWVGAAQARHASEYLQALGAIGRMREYALQRLIALSVDLPYLMLFLIALMLIGGRLVLVPLLAVGCFTLLVMRWGLALRAAIAKRNQHDAARYGFMLEALAGAHVMKSLGVEPRFIQHYQLMQQPVSRSGFTIALYNHALANSGAIFSQGMIVLVVATGAPMVMQNTISMGALIACVLLSGRLIQPLQHALTCWMSYQEYEQASAVAQRIRNLPVQPLSMVQDRQPHLPPVVIDHLAYSHDEAEPLLRDIHLTVTTGEVVGISGQSASGRSTLLKLIAGQLLPTQGSVAIHGMNPVTLPPHMLSQQLAYLDSEAVLLRGSIMQNLNGFDPGMQERALELSRLIGLDALVAQLPAGYETPLEGSGSDIIPPGLRQRVALVRALRHKPKLILFDQADRSLDRDGYHQLFSLLARLKGKATLILVSDDRNLLRLADRRFMLEGGSLHALDDTPQIRILHSLVKKVGVA